jgi:hypothetical protein
MKNLSKLILTPLLLLISSQALADVSITLDKQPSRMLVFSSGGTSTTNFILTGLDLVDLPSSDKSGTITSIDYVSASFSDSAEETAELCFYRAYSLTTPLLCQRIIPNFSDTTTEFEGLSFSNGIAVRIVHKVPGSDTGSFYYAEPNRTESVTFNYTTD